MPENPLETTNLQIQMLGQFQVFLEQEQVQWPTQKSKALFQILLIEPGRFVPTEQILEHLWPKLAPTNAQNNLWVTVSQLRRVLEPGLPARTQSSFIIKQGNGYHFNIESDYSLDLETFATLLSSAQSSNNSSKKISFWEKASDLYQGEFLENDPYEEWTQNPRLLWRQRYLQLLSNLAETYVQKAGRKPGGI